MQPKILWAAVLRLDPVSSTRRFIQIRFPVPAFPAISKDSKPASRDCHGTPQGIGGHYCGASWMI
jgi:hypothetical protein